MHILVDRIHSDFDATLSTVYIDGKFACFGLEDEYRKAKVAAETRIPAGTYNIGVRATGGFHGRYTARFPEFHKGMLQVLDVPGFDYILIHIGNTEHDTAGCLLIGLGATISGSVTLQTSTTAYRRFYNRVIAAALAGEVTIEYRDSDNACTASDGTTTVRT